MKKITSILMSSILALTPPMATIGTAASTEACTPATQAEFTQIDNVVLTDLKAGKTLVQIEDDVAAIVIPGNAGADIVTIVNAALTLLINLTGIIPPGLIPAATAMQTELAAKHVAGVKR